MNSRDTRDPEGCDCTELCSMGPTCPGGGLAGLPGTGCWRTGPDIEALLRCECGHSLDEHNGLGCYARLSYEPLVKCDCSLTDDRTYAELLAPRLAALADLITRHEAHDGRIPACQLRAVLGMPARDRGER